ncbi:AAA family ATPase [Ktedonosporobacter rubrisoli]|uniref:DNA helicase n=1 Tax=Ktedonosporobacter rubrisoli TaxID=2509675 RepID=A0A4P6JU16_KTERU|nr:AAA domain-containing protein [Ktedonosporobacter rubrisoli]QBD79109.1 AAA family ATPase [Ktedonosporobacter rubrisoli]
MATNETAEKHQAQQACFLCALDPSHHCQTPQLEGYIAAVQERQIRGEYTPVILLDTATERVELHLPGQYYRSLARELKARWHSQESHKLFLRVYHLPFKAQEIKYKDRVRLGYKANSYTLAVLEPDTLLNITDLHQAEYCQRQYLLKRLSPSVSTAATIRGNLIHHCFKELLKEHDRGKFTGSDKGQETPRQALERHLEQALRLNSIELALANVSAEEMRNEAQAHLESLAHWYESERTTLWDMPAAYSDNAQDIDETLQQGGNQVRAETFLLAPEIGLRGRLDLFWQQGDRQRLLELKTGGASGNLPKLEHRWQVHGYHSLLTVRRNSRMKRALATLVYSGTPGKAQAFGIPSSIREVQRVNERRNLLILSQITGIPAAPPGPSRCTRCSLLAHCQTVSSLLEWQPPEQETTAPSPLADVANPLPLHAVNARPLYPDTTEDREFFARYYRLLQKEGRASEQQQAQLWKNSLQQRQGNGTAINQLIPLGRAEIEHDGWLQTFRCDNTSELREGDEILLSNGDPITHEVVTGTILQISSEQVTVWTREIIAHPTLLDRYDNDLVHIRTQQNLLRWLHVAPHLRDLVAGKVRPRFYGQDVSTRPDFNQEQNLAIARALQMQDYLLIHGPPGTGKTSVIAEIVKRLRQQGQRILLAAFTNQAVDNMLKRLEREGIHDYLRLGHERSTAETVRPHLLKALVAANTAQAENEAELVKDILNTTPIVGSTTATWSSDHYTSPTHDDEVAGEQPTLYFDVAIIDEAGQLTVPAILGALRLAKRFILVGDEKQLPPLVLSKEAAEAGLAESLFSILKRLDDDYTKKQALAISACVALRTQYRMNKWISHFSSTIFYDKQLIAHESIADRRLVFKNTVSRDADSAIERAIRPDLPLVFLDVKDQQAQEMEKRSDAEARVICMLVAELLARGIEAEEIGIIAPYRAQVANIRRHLFSGTDTWQALDPQQTALNIDTVDRFQGGERTVIIMSFATTHEPEPGSQRREFLLDPHRLNVALTRAQRKLILVGNLAALASLPTFSRLITYCRSMQTLIHYDKESAHQTELWEPDKLSGGVGASLS